MAWIFRSHWQRRISALVWLTFAISVSGPGGAQTLDRPLQDLSGVGCIAVTCRNPNVPPGVTSAPAPAASPAPVPAPSPVQMPPPVSMSTSEQATPNASASVRPTSNAPPVTRLNNDLNDIGSMPMAPQPQATPGGFGPTTSSKSIAPSTFNTQSTFPAVQALTSAQPSTSLTMTKPGGIYLSKAAAERMPLNLSLDGAFIDRDRIVLSGRGNADSTIDAALFLTALRAACAGQDPYFSLDPDDISAWIRETNEAGEEFRQRTANEFRWSFRKGLSRGTPGILKFRTLSASRDFPGIWTAIRDKYPGLRSRLVFKPEWLRGTRFGEILYKADVLLKELAGGRSMLGVERLRAADIDGYRSAVDRRAARDLLYVYNGIARKPAAQAGGRIWYDLAETSDMVARRGEEISFPESELRDMLDRKGLLTKVTGQPAASSLSETDGVIDVSEIFPRMYVRVRDPVTLRDGVGTYPGLDELTDEANKNPRGYAKEYKEFRQLVEVFRAYVVAVRVRQRYSNACATVPPTLLEAEK